MPTATWNGTVIAEAPDDAVEIVEGNVYFSMHSVHQEYLQPSEHASTCPWKGSASYYHVAVNGSMNRDAAWTYRNPKEAAKNIANRIAFWHGVSVER